MKRVVFALVVLFIVLGLIQLFWHLNVLPEKVATHFDAQGNPDGFMSKRGFGLFQLALGIGLPLTMIGTAKLCYVLPNSMINMPNKEYWLHPDRRDATLESTESWLGWFCIGTQVFLISLQQLIFESNVRGEPLPMVLFAVLMGLYLLFVTGASIYLIRKFRLPSRED